MTTELIDWNQDPDAMSKEELIFFITRSNLAVESVKNGKIPDIEYSFAVACHKRYTDALSLK